MRLVGTYRVRPRLSWLTGRVGHTYCAWMACLVGRRGLVARPEQWRHRVSRGPATAGGAPVREVPRRAVTHLVLLAALLACVPVGEGQGESLRDRCTHGLALHGSGQWGRALEVFADAIGEEMTGRGLENLEAAVDCIFGAALSLNTLGRTDDSLAAFRLSQRLQRLHPRGPRHLAVAGAARCIAASAAKASQPYMSCNTVRAMANHIHDALDGTNCRFSPDAVAYGDVVYANALLLDDFILNKHPFIRHPYVLVTHCSDASAPAHHEDVLNDPKLLAWYAQNPDLSDHEKLHPLPIGLANKDFAHGDIDAVTRVRRETHTKMGWLYVNINPETSPDRRRALEAVKGQPFATMGTQSDFETYLRHMAAHRFVLCPAGNGLDTHRVWEALLVGSIPVTASSPMDALLRRLPVVIVDDWDEITLPLLEQAYSTLQEHGLGEGGDKFTQPELFAAAWERQLRSHS